MLRNVIVAVVLFGALAPLAPTATAGGWAAVVLAEPLQTVTAGQEVTIEYRVLAHANPDTPLSRIAVDFLFLHAETGFFQAVTGTATADPEVSTLTFTLDQSGDWEMRSMIREYAGRPLLQRHPVLAAHADAARIQALAEAVATPLPDRPGLVTITDDALAPWRLEVPLGLKVLFTNERARPVTVSFTSGGAWDVLELAPGATEMWYSIAPGDYLVAVGPAPAYRVGTITVTGKS